MTASSTPKLFFHTARTQIRRQTTTVMTKVSEMHTARMVGYCEIALTSGETWYTHCCIRPALL